MNIYKVEQDLIGGYDVWDSFVCVAETEQEARETYPSQYVTYHRDGYWYEITRGGDELKVVGRNWVRFDQIDQLKVTLIGVADEKQTKGVIVASYNAS